MQTFKRCEKVAEAIHELVSGLMVKGLKDPRVGFVTITGVRVSEDLHLATIFYTVMGGEEERKATSSGLDSARGFIRREIGKSLHMRYTPDITFRYDQSLDQGNRIDGILREIAGRELDDDRKD